MSKGKVWWSGLDAVEGLVAVGTEGEERSPEEPDSAELWTSCEKEFEWQETRVEMLHHLQEPGMLPADGRAGQGGQRDHCWGM